MSSEANAKTGTQDTSAFVRIDSVEAARRLAHEILDPGRSRAIVCLSVRRGDQDPLVRADDVAKAIGDGASIHVLPTGEQSWALSERLPPRLDVYGGAARVWWPFGDREPDPDEQPLFFTYDPAKAHATVERITQVFRRRRLASDERMAPGSEAPGVVTRVTEQGAELSLPGGHPAFAHRTHLTTASGVAPEQVVRPGQAVRARLAEDQDGGSRARVSLLPSEPDPWKRLAEQYGEGAIVEGIVEEFRNFGAFVTLLPGVQGLLHRSRISSEWVSHPEDFLELGERVVVKIESLDADDRRIELSMRDVPAGAESVRPAALYPDGPSWLPEALDAQPVERAMRHDAAPRLVPRPRGRATPPRG